MVDVLGLPTTPAPMQGDPVGLRAAAEERASLAQRQDVRPRAVE